MVHGVLLIAGREVEDPAAAAVVGDARAEDLAARERGEEHLLVGARDVELLAVHLLPVDDDRMRDPLGDLVLRRDGPDQLALAVVPPLQRAGRAHQAREHLRVGAGVQDDVAHAGVHVADHARDDLVGHLAVRDVAPPVEDGGGGEALLGEAVLILLEGRGVHARVVAEQLAEAVGDHRVDPVRVVRQDCRVPPALVHVLVPDDDVHGAPRSAVIGGSGRAPVLSALDRPRRRGMNAPTIVRMPRADAGDPGGRMNAIAYDLTGAIR